MVRGRKVWSFGDGPDQGGGDWAGPLSRKMLFGTKSEGSADEKCSVPTSPNGNPVFVLDELERALRLRRRSPKTIKAYRYWTKRFLVFHEPRPVEELGGKDARDFLEHLAVVEKVAASTQTQALCALVFFFKAVMGRPVGDLGGFSRPRRPVRIPVILSNLEAVRILDFMSLPHKLAGQLMYGAGLRVGEAAKLRVKDVDFARQELILRDTKSRRDRVSVLPGVLLEDLRRQVGFVRKIHADDQLRGDIVAPLPDALLKKKPNACRELGWQFLFPSSRPKSERGSGSEIRYRWHISPTSIQGAVKQAVRDSGITKPATCHSFRHSFATELLRSGTDVRTVQALMGHRSLKTTQVYLHLIGKGAFGVRSPLD